MAGIDRVKYPSLPSNYVTIAELKERWLKEKERKQQEEKEKLENEEKEKHPVLHIQHNRIANGCTSVGKTLQKCENRKGKGWCEVGLIAKEPKLKEVRMNAPVVEEGVDRTRGKEKMGSFGDRKPRVESDMAKVSTIDVAEEKMMAVVSVEKGGKETSKGKCKWNSGSQEVEVVADVCMVEVVGESNVDREIEGKKCRVVFSGKKNNWRAEQSGQKHNAGKEKVTVDVKERTNEKVRVSGAFRAYCDNEVASVCTVEVVGENKVDREITGQTCGVGYRGKKNGGRKMGVRVGEVSEKADIAEQSGQKHNAGKEKVSVDVKERTSEKVRVGGAFRAYGDKEVASVDVEVVGENKVDREITGQNCGVEFRGKKKSWRKIGDRVGEVSNKAESVEQSGQKHNAGKEMVPVNVKERTNEKVRVRGAYRGKKNSGKQMVDRVGEVSDKADSAEQSGQECNAEKEKVSVDLKERANEKVTVSGAFHAYSDKEVEEVATVCTVEVIEENKVDREISGKKHTIGLRGKKHKVVFKGKKPSWRKIGDRVGEVSDKANSVEQSGREHNAEKEKVSVDVKERANEKARVRGAFHTYSDKSKDVLIDSEAGLKMTIEGELGDLSLTDRRYGHGRSSVRVHGDKSYGSSRRYEPRKMLKQRDNSFVWIKKGESSNGNVAEVETQD